MPLEKGRDEIEEQEYKSDRRLRALYAVACALQGDLDPAFVTLSGLKALIRGLPADCGYGAFFDRNTQEFEIVASQGLSHWFLTEISERLKRRSLVRSVIDRGVGLIVRDIWNDARIPGDLAKKEGLRSSLIVPLRCDNTTLGALILYRKNEEPFSVEEFEVATVGASQICSAARQAEFLAAEKRQLNSLNSLYRLSHEISRWENPDQIARAAFPVLNEELGTKRIWLGTLNDAGTHLVGQAGFGEGMRRPIETVQIELSRQHDFLDAALSTREIAIVPEDAEMECSGLTRILHLLKIRSLVVAPLVALDTLVGVLVIEPKEPHEFTKRNKLPVLASMASELATVLLARKYEAKVAADEKMKTVGLLASGVAHNFNNILQAVLGQASYLDLRLEPSSPLKEPIRSIMDGAKRGASLVTHLLQFSMLDNPERTKINLSSMLLESRGFYQSFLGEEVELAVDVPGFGCEVFGNYGQLQQVVAELLINAKEASTGRKDAYVRIRARRVQLSSAEVEPPLHPGEYVQIAVEDNGSGMDPEKLRRCFEPFFTTKHLDHSTGIGVTGAGMGLASAYSIVRQHGGTIVAQSTEGKGSLFTVIIPTLEAVLLVQQSPLSEEKPIDLIPRKVVGAR